MKLIFWIMCTGVIICYACNKERSPKWIVGFGLLQQQVVINDTLSGHYLMMESVPANVSFYLCGPVDEDLDLLHQKYTLSTSKLDSLYVRMNARLMNDHCFVQEDRNGEYNYFWIPTPEFVDVGKTYLWVVDIRFVDSDYVDANDISHFVVHASMDEE